MTLTEINNLTVEDNESYLINRLWSKEDPKPFEEPTYTYLQLEAELDLYKEELTVVETERLRIEDLKSRFDAVSDHSLLESAFEYRPNLKKFRNYELIEMAHEDAESIVSNMEAEYVNLQPVRDLAECYKNRIEAYGPWDKQLEEIYDDIDAWKSRLQAIKAQYPKPE